MNSENEEEHCWQLAINEYDPQTEFRCHYGLCIPLSLLNDEIHNLDCLDRTDEDIYKSISFSDLSDARRSIPLMCYRHSALK